jgi:hypothetical protein
MSLAVVVQANCADAGDAANSIPKSRTPALAHRLRMKSRLRFRVVGGAVLPPTRSAVGLLPVVICVSEHARA